MGYDEYIKQNEDVLLDVSMYSTVSAMITLKYTTISGPL